MFEIRWTLTDFFLIVVFVVVGKDNLLICFVLLVQHSVYPTKVPLWSAHDRYSSESWLTSQNGPSAHIFPGLKFIVFTFPTWSWSVASFSTTDQMAYAGPLNSKIKLTFCCNPGSPSSKLNRGHNSVSIASWFRFCIKFISKHSLKHDLWLCDETMIAGEPHQIKDTYLRIHLEMYFILF